ncbi:hypothetical protein EON63_21740, partial [archaeon]
PGNLIMDYFWGTELYPRILGWDVKQFTNCRFGMMWWQVALLIYMYKQHALYGYVSSSMLVSVLLQSVYIGKFFLWETGYFCSMDIQHDRAGYYICWGCMVWVPSMYSMHTFYMVQHPVLLSLPVAGGIFAAGKGVTRWGWMHRLLVYIQIYMYALVCVHIHICMSPIISVTVPIPTAGVYMIWMNYDCDRQRQDFRATQGRSKIWGREPVYVTVCVYGYGWMGACMHCMFIHTHTYAHTHVHTHITCLYVAHTHDTNTVAHVHTYTYTRSQSHTHTHIHTPYPGILPDERR